MRHHESTGHPLRQLSQSVEDNNDDEEAGSLSSSTTTATDNIDTSPRQIIVCCKTGDTWGMNCYRCLFYLLGYIPKCLEAFLFLFLLRYFIFLFDNHFYAFLAGLTTGATLSVFVFEPLASSMYCPPNILCAIYYCCLIWTLFHAILSALVLMGKITRIKVAPDVCFQSNCCSSLAQAHPSHYTGLFLGLCIALPITSPLSYFNNNNNNNNIEDLYCHPTQLYPLFLVYIPCALVSFISSLAYIPSLLSLPHQQQQQPPSNEVIL